MIFKFLIIYLVIINLIAVLLTVFDKISAIRHKRRIRESTLLFVSILGGSIFMLLTMLFIHHKTRHPKFMFGIPAIIIVQLSLIAIVCELL